MTPSGASVSALSTWFLLTLAPVIGASRSPGSVQSSSSPFSFGERLGLVFIAEASACSCLAVTCLLLYFAVRKNPSFFSPSVTILPLRSSMSSTIVARCNQHVRS
ncbi:uncharacterized protein EI90DRAFT_790528 [Cantharellus anzutake]|uniref:uncharacterized protein n=1 Tax=Cantharellus anzutake TaxID=1750568 RepID=UPI001905E7E0|nr:uncharacterized protein EI90DRAFT_790528 [Cantharellus anzutake]KAF8342808.1 hypothetical protein EI90DRAFT_790528 [Cantharellus anzutake]